MVPSVVLRAGGGAVTGCPVTWCPDGAGSARAVGDAACGLPSTVVELHALAASAAAVKAAASAASTV
ncbi:hypothetical protein [Mycobacteroides immunogenum]|uniref:hypothetical protein n=1 Tax=Mycobacteroides immunogenum TaxID=83262 RepID=UPI0006C8455B|nr:hypothetical protein [Mycobacteroides immunogenum]KPG31809.1 hypothetical protein AN914_25880 [Mycobacteroides immunogenum]